jgi:hypothetical protein
VLNSTETDFGTENQKTTATSISVADLDTPANYKYRTAKIERLINVVIAWCYTCLRLKNNFLSQICEMIECRYLVDILKWI